MLPVGGNSSLLEHVPFQMGFGVQESKKEVTKIVSLVNNGISTKRIGHFKFFGVKLQTIFVHFSSAFLYFCRLEC